MIPDLAVHGTPSSDDAAYLSPSSQSYVPCFQERPFIVLVVSAPAEAAKLLRWRAETKGCSARSVMVIGNSAEVCDSLITTTTSLSQSRTGNVR
ncbi:hypothetical protein K456DRAFT_772020 [Colletotrichum gloeosporioides 23]|nr:hypothetical protein K456DRAFT_772020 [Colletotrichum gloeosporioides 23]